MAELNILDASTVSLIKTNANDLDVAHAAWVSNFGEGAVQKETSESRLKGLINFLYSNHHDSPFEHGSFTFFVHTPLFVAREWHRHRTQSYNESSGRYMELSPTFYIPNKQRPIVQSGKIGNYNFVPGTDDQYDLIEKCLIDAYASGWSNYQIMLEAGVAKEVARMALNLGLYTSFYATANPRNVMQFLLLRNENQALYEIRQAAVQVEAIFKQTMPLTWHAFNSKRDTLAKINKLLEVVSIDELISTYLEDG